MKSRIAFAILPLTIALSILACNINVQPTAVNPNEAAATIVAKTLQAQGLPTSPASGATPSSSPAAASPSPTLKPTLHIDTNNAKCRASANTDAKVVVTYEAGTTVDLIGKDTADSFWLVNDPGGKGLCWVQMQDGTPGGSYSSIQEITPQPTTQGVPARPGSISYTYSCDSASLTTNMSWSDAANNETGYHVYRQGTQIADLPANSSAYTDTVAYTAGTPITYAVEAYNDAGASPQRSIKFQCP